MSMDYAQGKRETLPPYDSLDRFDEEEGYIRDDSSYERNSSVPEFPSHRDISSLRSLSSMDHPHIEEAYASDSTISSSLDYKDEYHQPEDFLRVRSSRRSKTKQRYDISDNSLSYSENMKSSAAVEHSFFEEREFEEGNKRKSIGLPGEQIRGVQFASEVEVMDPRDPIGLLGKSVSDSELVSPPMHSHDDPTIPLLSSPLPSYSLSPSINMQYEQVRPHSVQLDPVSPGVRHRSGPISPASDIGDFRRHIKFDAFTKHRPIGRTSMLHHMNSHGFDQRRKLAPHLMKHQANSSTAVMSDEEARRKLRKAPQTLRRFRQRLHPSSGEAADQPSDGSYLPFFPFPEDDLDRKGRVCSYSITLAIDLESMISRVEQAFPDYRIDIEDDYIHIIKFRSIHGTGDIIPADLSIPEITADAFVFGYGSVVFWAWESVKDEINFLVKTKLLSSKLEAVEYDEYDFSFFNHARIVGDDIFVPLEEPRCFKSKLAISHALAQSVKISLFEENVNQAIEESQPFMEKLAESGKSPLSKAEISQRIGRLFLLRSSVTLDSNIVDVPEYFWEEGEYQPLYHSARNLCDIERRVDTLNKKLDTLDSLYQVLNEERSSQHHVFLEWIVIILILVEVVLAVFQEVVSVLRDRSS